MGRSSPPYDVLISFLAYSGLRFGEMAALRTRDVDLARRRVHVVTNLVEVGGRLIRGTPKTHRTRTVPFPRFMARDLAELITGRSPGDADSVRTEEGTEQDTEDDTDKD